MYAMDDRPLFMKSSIDNLPPPKQRELRKTVKLLLEEFEDALKGGTADFKRRGRILKIILLGPMRVATGSTSRIPGRAIVRISICWWW
ncbi:hypothetical protein A4R28_30235 (plasmid) [Mesorhizobium ciceri]|nr:hypothetical protein A4R28_30235 [Mesorhizobium ciceri]